ncbi:hypothetical protein BH23BAC3_BH23BAC3_30500 [soil metagenome]
MKLYNEHNKRFLKVSGFRLSFVLSILLCGLVNLSFGQTNTSNNELQVKESILDYVEGVYEADTTRIYRSVHPTLVKRGTWYDNQIGDYVPLDEMNFQQLVQLTKTWNSDGQNADSSSSREISIYDLQDKTATAKLTAVWGTDYMHLAKIEGKWYIMNVLWQTHERK